ncbi:MAG: type II toxin-antitoxin system Phd/YefM family antitoxin [Pseudomonadota bacterium]|nr:type II toxin-antitoxin system Phd/YefM family antitoxin [Pseudomonadota bacterium]
MIVTITEAKSRLPSLIDLALSGEEVVIARRGKALVRLAPVQTLTKKRVCGSMKGKIALDETFFDPLPEDELALWNGEGD